MDGGRLGDDVSCAAEGACAPEPPGPADEQCLEDAFRASFRILVHRNQRLLANRCDSEDAAQDAFLAALESQAKGMPAPSLPWLGTVAKRRAVDEIRRRERDQRRFARLASRARVDEVAVDVAEAVADVSAARHAVASLGSLPASTRLVVDLIAHGQDTRSTATALGMSNRAAESHLQRARKHLRTSGQAVLLPVLVLWKGFRRIRRMSLAAVPAVTLVAAVVVGVLQIPEGGSPHTTGDHKGASRPRPTGQPIRLAPSPRPTHIPHMATAAPSAGPVTHAPLHRPPDRSPISATPSASVLATLPVPVVRQTAQVTVENRPGPSSVPDALVDCLLHQQVNLDHVGC